jgi:hypothetical protein
VPEIWAIAVLFGRIETYGVFNKLASKINWSVMDVRKKDLFKQAPHNSGIKNHIIIVSQLGAFNLTQI